MSFVTATIVIPETRTFIGSFSFAFIEPQMVFTFTRSLTGPLFSLDITAEQHRSRVLGIKGAAVSLGGVTGPMLVAGVSTTTTPQGVFSIAGVLIVIGVVLAFTFLREPRRVTEPGDVAWAVSGQRAIAAQAALRGVVLRARMAREAREALP